MNAKVKLVEKMSKAGNPYKVLSLEVNGKTIELHCNYVDIKLLEFILQ